MAKISIEVGHPENCSAILNYKSAKNYYNEQSARYMRGEITTSELNLARDLYQNAADALSR